MSNHFETSDPTPPETADSSATRLKSFVERIERLDEERAGITAAIRDVYSELAGTGFDKKTVRKIVALRKMDAADRAEQAELLELYGTALGMIV